MSKRYSSDLSDQEWLLIKAHFRSQYNRNGSPHQKISENILMRFLCFKERLYLERFAKRISLLEDDL